MKDAIREILTSVPSEHVVDTHFVIDTLIRSHSDAYLAYASAFANGTGMTVSMHGHIGKQVALFEDDLLDRIGDSWSQTIHGTPGKCTCWRKR